jgi:hypothetical protein
MAHLFAQLFRSLPDRLDRVEKISRRKFDPILFFDPPDPHMTETGKQGSENDDRHQHKGYKNDHKSGLQLHPHIPAAIKNNCNS